MLQESELLHRLKSYDPTFDGALVSRAYHFSQNAHGDQIRASGESYFSHPLEVASILLDLKLDCFSIITALLHDTVEDTLATLEEIKQQFGAEIGRLVDGVTKLSRLELQSEETKQAENFQKLVLAMSSDIRVLLVKLADRVHNMRTLNHIIDDSKRRRIARETMEIYAPLAERMGMHSLKDELEDLSFATLNAEMHQSIKTRLDFLREASENAIGFILEDLKRVLDEASIKGTINGRLKTPYSIWRKIQRKSITFEQLSDIMAFRIIVETNPECYQVLGTIHSQYLVVPGRFKDYISTSKPNGYQSLHTGVIGPLNQRIEVQIRTKDMNRISELGVAAHWQYKKGGPVHDGKQYAWLRSLLEILEQASSPEEFLEHTKLEMFQDQVFCFTPQGELISLPKGATPIDFAYAIHSEVGDRAVGAKINGRQMPLRSVLNNGDQVEITTYQNQCPSPTWERFVVTGKARARIRRFIRSQQRDQFKELGKSLLQKVCMKEGVTYSEKAIGLAVKHFQFDMIDDLLAAIGEGIQSAREVVTIAYPNSQKKELKTDQPEGEIPKIAPKAEGGKHPSLSIEGLIPGMAVHFAGCCHPLPGDTIRGIVVTGSGVTIHTFDCESLHTIDPDRLLDLSWHTTNRNQNMRHVGRLKVTFINKAGSLAGMSTAITKHQGNIVNLKIINRTVDFWDLIVDIEVKDVEHLIHIKTVLRSLAIIHNADRI
ncbi:RelA/SpoT family protein [Candidatus Finniella inopinata]|uniref:GTP pyrophosphokinase rsh n=1 Tax=Candidatus Finniella inopinata TaxID=1696036 RepID=A0A4Q7DJE8_9PROT|nr:bifunctional (p)ppGpp synthetase/guanosine-3',5'-bis(diphosphate) 3'-pyrophosphohydrolase [Candidatus Finniella inopinata]RZI46872.1 bifunctional (p)ppGpp synthetase/guanosine-3',5'-bis(diphosphate) 3'-pyrophosphohydrolase [Candidatus Finniella inopinata]